MKLIARPFYFFFFIAFTFFGFHVNGQTKVEQHNQNGLITTIFNTPLGNVTVYLPEHSTNESISGTIKVRPTGTNENKKAKHKIELQSYHLEYANTSIPLTKEHFFISASNSTKNNGLGLVDKKGKVVLNSVISQKTTEELQSPSFNYIPEYMVSGEAAKITSRFDGNSTNSSAKLNSKDLEILAESKSGMFFRVPSNVSGTSQLQFEEGSHVAESSVNVLNTDLSVGRTNLKRGETTTLSIKVSGLEGLQTDVPITITNKSPSNISLEGGNTQQIVINPLTDASSGTYSDQITIRATQTGNFTISVNVNPPTPKTETDQDKLLCNCKLNQLTYLLAPEACQNLGGSCSDVLENNAVEEDEANVSPPNFGIQMPHIINAENPSVTLHIRDYHQNDCVAAIFSYKSSDEESWKSIGSDNNNQDGLSVNWNIPTEHDGIIEIRAQVVNKNNVTASKTGLIYLNTTPIAFTNNNLNVSYTVTDSDIKRAEDKVKKTGDDIDGLGDDIFKKQGERRDAEDRKKKNEDAKNELIAIDKVLDSIPKTYKDALKKILDSLANLKKQLPEIIDNATLQKAIDDAQSRVDDCQDRLEKLKKEQQELEKERDRLKAETDKALEDMDALMRENGMTGGYGYHPDGRYWYGYVGDENSNGDVMYTDEYNKLHSKLRGLRKQYLKTLKRLNNLPDEIAEAEKDCEELNNALAKAKTAKKNADLHAATELKADDICREISRLLRPLWQWCIKNPNHCDFKAEIEDLMKRCPKDSSELDTFWNDFNDLVSHKKEQEDNFKKAAKNDQKDIDDIDDDIAGLENQIKALEEKKKKEIEAADALRKQRAAEAAKAKAKADARAKEKKKQKEDDDKIKDLIKKAKADDAGDDALQNLLKGMGLDLLDEASGNLKLGKIIGGLLVIKDIPDCACPLIKALRDAIGARKRGEDPFVYVNDYIFKWKKCANLPSISTVMEGAQQLTEAINNMTRDQVDRAMKALNQAIRIQCK